MRRWILAGAIVAALGGAAVWGQGVDASGGGPPMVPGGGAEKSAGGTAAADPNKTVYEAPSGEEQMSRALLQLKAERAGAAGKYAADDPRVADLDGRIAELRERMAGSHGAGGGTDAAGGNGEGGGLEAASMVPHMGVEESSSGANPRYASSQVISDSESPQTLATLKTLAQTRITVVMEAQSVDAFFKFFESQTHLNVEVNWTALAAATPPVDRNTPATLRLAEVPADQVLRILLATVGGATSSLTYTVDKGIVVISTKDDLQAARFQEVRVFNVRDLVAGDLSLYPAGYAAQVYAARVEKLQDTIKSVVAPDTWRDAGGTIGSIREFNGMLIINQTGDNHREIESLLAKLRGGR